MHTTYIETQKKTYTSQRGDINNHRHVHVNYSYTKFVILDITPFYDLMTHSIHTRLPLSVVYVYLHLHVGVPR